MFIIDLDYLALTIFDVRRETVNKKFAEKIKISYLGQTSTSSCLSVWNVSLLRMQQERIVSHKNNNAKADKKLLNTNWN